MTNETLGLEPDVQWSALRLALKSILNSDLDNAKSILQSNFANNPATDPTNDDEYVSHLQHVADLTDYEDTSACDFSATLVWLLIYLLEGDYSKLSSLMGCLEYDALILLIQAGQISDAAVERALSGQESGGFEYQTTILVAARAYIELGNPPLAKSWLSQLDSAELESPIRETYDGLMTRAMRFEN